MAKIQLLVGSTNNTINVFIQDTTGVGGAGLSGLAYNTAGLTAYYALPKAAPVAITLATQTVTGAYSSGGFVELDATHTKGLYRLDIPDAAVASGRFANIYLYGAANMAPVVLEIELTATNNQDGVRGGMTALPNAAAEAAGGLFTRGTGAGQINQDGNGRIDTNTAAINANTTAPVKLAAAADTMVAGTAQTGTLSTTQCTTNLTPAQTDLYKNRTMMWKTGSNAGARGAISANSTGGLFTFDALPVAVSNGDTFEIV